MTSCVSSGEDNVDLAHLCLPLQSKVQFVDAGHLHGWPWLQSTVDDDTVGLSVGTSVGLLVGAVDGIEVSWDVRSSIGCSVVVVDVGNAVGSSEGADATPSSSPDDDDDDGGIYFLVNCNCMESMTTSARIIQPDKYQKLEWDV